MGSVRLLFITDKRNILGRNEEYIYTTTGRIPLRDLMGILSFANIKVFRDLRVPVVVVKNEGISLLNGRTGRGGVGDLELEAFAYDVGDFSLRVAKRSSDRLSVTGFRVLYGFCTMERLLFNTFCAFLILYFSRHIRLLTDIQIKLRVYGQELELWELLFLPPVTYALIKELGRIVNYGLEPYRSPKECVNLLLSYFLGNQRFLLLLRRNLRLILQHSIAELNLTEAHGGLPAHTRELSEPCECPEPPDRLPVS